MFFLKGSGWRWRGYGGERTPDFGGVRSTGTVLDRQVLDCNSGLGHAGSPTPGHRTPWVHSTAGDRTPPPPPPPPPFPLWAPKVPRSNRRRPTSSEWPWKACPTRANPQFFLPSPVASSGAGHSGNSQAHIFWPSLLKQAPPDCSRGKAGRQNSRNIMNRRTPQI